MGNFNGKRMLLMTKNVTFSIFVEMIFRVIRRRRFQENGFCEKFLFSFGRSHRERNQAKFLLNACLHYNVLKTLILNQFTVHVKEQNKELSIIFTTYIFIY